VLENNLLKTPRGVREQYREYLPYMLLMDGRYEYKPPVRRKHLEIDAVLKDFLNKDPQKVWAKK